MSAKLKILIFLILSIFAAVIGGISYIAKREPSPSIAAITSKGEQQRFPAAETAAELVSNSGRVNYKTIPLAQVTSVIQGTDPVTLATYAFDNMESKGGTRKIEIVYPQRNQALVTITRTKMSENSVRAIKYRVEFTKFGRSLLVSSPPLWQIVWIGYQEQCRDTTGVQLVASSTTCQ
ncbi:MAG: hypothetical protein QNJ47_01080 [Nostocaceae cyanobacterium]|nr:hypothetical protein [Nostocaceae cyanobacterium]